MNETYTQHDKAFDRVSAYVVAKDGERVATIAFKFPADGAGRLYAYVHWLGLEMVRGFAGGYGYDKRAASCADAMRKLAKHREIADTPGCKESMLHAAGFEYQSLRDSAGFRAFVDALAKDGGEHWDSALRDAGFTVWQAV